MRLCAVDERAAAVADAAQPARGIAAEVRHAPQSAATLRSLAGVLRRIVAFVADELGDQVAVLECHHRQHVRHRPPFRVAPWVEDAAERERHIGTTLDCPLCERCELPDGLTVVRTTATWDDVTMPDALRRAHRVASGAWDGLRVERGSLRFVAHTDPITDVIVGPDGSQ